MKIKLTKSQKKQALFASVAVAITAIIILAPPSVPTRSRENPEGYGPSGRPQRSREKPSQTAGVGAFRI